MRVLSGFRRGGGPSRVAMTLSLVPRSWERSLASWTEHDSGGARRARILALPPTVTVKAAKDLVELDAQWGKPEEAEEFKTAVKAAEASARKE